MKFLTSVGGIFWNREEKRLRALWRIAIQAGMVVVITSLLTVGLMIFGLAADAIFAGQLGQSLQGMEAVQIQNLPLILLVLVAFATFLGVLAATLVAGKFLDKRRIRDFGLQLDKAWWQDFAFGLLLGACLMGLIFLFGWGTGNVRLIGFFQPVRENSGFLGGFLQSLMFYIFVGFYEEILTRGYHLVNLSEGLNLKPVGKKWAIVLAVLVTSLVFGVLHLGNPNAGWVSTINIAIVGVIFSLGMIYSRSLAIPIGLHITWNFFQGNVFGFPVSGTRNGGTLIATEMAGPDWLTGGRFGPEAGLIGLVAMLLGGLIILLWLRRKRPLSLQTELAEYPSEDQGPTKENSL